RKALAIAAACSSATSVSTLASSAWAFAAFASARAAFARDPRLLYLTAASVEMLAAILTNRMMTFLQASDLNEGACGLFKSRPIIFVGDQPSKGCPSRPARPLVPKGNADPGTGSVTSRCRGGVGAVCLLRVGGGAHRRPCAAGAGRGGVAAAVAVAA